jgi:hypothetical protein
MKTILTLREVKGSCNQRGRGESLSPAKKGKKKKDKKKQENAGKKTIVCQKKIKI